MDEKAITQLCKECFGAEPEYVKRCAVGLANYVYIVEREHQKITIRCSTENDAYKNAIYWLERLGQINVPVPEVLRSGEYRGYSYLILSYLEGQDLGLVYPQLTMEEKRTIAKEIVEIQNRMATLQLENVDEEWSWESFIQYILDRAKVLMYCVDFMGERGMQFMDKKIEVNDTVISRLNGIYERLWSEFTKNKNYL